MASQALLLKQVEAQELELAQELVTLEPMWMCQAHHQRPLLALPIQLPV